jgi:hypothetical protein
MHGVFSFAHHEKRGGDGESEEARHHIEWRRVDRAKLSTRSLQEALLLVSIPSAIAAEFIEGASYPRPESPGVATATWN